MVTSEDGALEISRIRGSGSLGKVPDTVMGFADRLLRAMGCWKRRQTFVLAGLILRS